MTREEMETVINFSAADEMMDIYTADPVWLRKLDKLVVEHPENYRVIETRFFEGRVCSKRYLAPKKLLTVRGYTRTLTAEQREAAASNFSKNRPV